MLIIYAVIALAVVTAVGGLVWKYNNAVEGRIIAEQEAEASKKIAANWKATAEKRQGDFDASETISHDRGVQIKALSAKLARKSQSRTGLGKNKPAAAIYLGTAVDPDVRLQRRIDSGCSPDINVQCTPVTSGTDATTPVVGRDERKPDSGERSSTSSVGGSERR